MKFNFGMQINIEVSYKLILSLSNHSQSTQNKKFVISVQYVKENVKDEVEFLPACKHQSFLQIDTIILGACGQACPNYPK